MEHEFRQVWAADPDYAREHRRYRRALLLAPIPGLSAAVLGFWALGLPFLALAAADLLWISGGGLLDGPGYDKLGFALAIWVGLTVSAYQATTTKFAESAYAAMILAQAAANPWQSSRRRCPRCGALAAPSDAYCAPCSPALHPSPRAAALLGDVMAQYEPRALSVVGGPMRFPYTVHAPSGATRQVGRRAHDWELRARQEAFDSATIRAGSEGSAFEDPAAGPDIVWLWWHYVVRHRDTMYPIVNFDRVRVADGKIVELWPYCVLLPTRHVRDGVLEPAE